MQKWNYIKEGKLPELKYHEHIEWFGDIYKSNCCLVLTDNYVTHVGYYVEISPKRALDMVKEWWLKSATSDMDTDTVRIMNVKGWVEMDISPDEE